MAKYARILDKRRHKRRRKRSVETGWGRSAARRSRIWFVWMAFGLVVACLTAGFVLSGRGGGDGRTPVKKSTRDEVAEGLVAAEAVANAFLKETDPEARLRWVRNAGEVMKRMACYPVQALSEPGEIDKVIGHSDSSTAFAVTMPNGEMRLLELVSTAEGPRVDWDAYAIHGTASWEDLWSGKAQRAMVRVFCEPATETQEPFDDQTKWTCFRLSSPDMPHAALGFAEVGSTREAMMKQVVLGTPNYRQRFVLEVVRHEGRGEPLFEISRCVSVGWITGEREVEEIWDENK